MISNRSFLEDLPSNTNDLILNLAQYPHLCFSLQLLNDRARNTETHGIAGPQPQKYPCNRFYSGFGHTNTETRV
jgi:hypothetical protein